jgi:hypothetical protein
MMQKSKEARSPVSKERAMEHALLTIRRAWAGEVRGFEGWGGFQLDPEPIVLYDLNGQILFYEFGVMDGKELVGSVKASASKIIGSAVPTVEFGPRGWDPDDALKKANDEIKTRFPKANIIEKELVCYSYPKIGVRIDIEEPEIGSQSLVLDVADLSLVERFGADELEGFTAYSFYQEIAEPNAFEREQRWELADRELEAARSATPRVFEPAFTAREMLDIRRTLVPQPVYPIPFYSSRTLQYSPRCPDRSHECFVLYGQETDYYCACATGQMILDFYRYYYTQDQIAEAMGTYEPDELYPGHPGGTYNSGQVNGYESLSNNCLNATYDTTANWSEAKAEINANRPLKSGIFGHARACAGWKRQNIFIIGQKPKRWLYIYDPWPWNANSCQGGKILWEDWDAITHYNFIYVRHRVTPCT